MGRRRSKNLKLAVNWSLERGTYYFRPARGTKRIRLGRSLSEAYVAYGTLLERNHRPQTKLSGWMDRYRAKVLPTKAPRTQKDQLKEMDNLERTFGHLRPEEVTPHMIYQYRDARGAPVRFNREKALLSHLFTKIIEWSEDFKGPNPCREVKRNTETPKDRYVEDWEFAAFLKHALPLLKWFAFIKLKTGLRKGDILRIQNSALTPEGIRLIVRKTTRKRKKEGGVEIATEGKLVTFAWDAELRQAVDGALALPRKVGSVFLFCNRKGQPYTESGFDAIWKRYMKRTVEKEGIAPFSDHDIRAKTASDDPENAQKRLQHASAKTTESYIRSRRKIVVAPLDGAVDRVVKAATELEKIKKIRGQSD